MAPELLKGEYDLSADIFSYGVIITEALAGREAEQIIDETRTDAFGLDGGGLRALLVPDVHLQACHSLVDVALRCCELDSTKRPTAEELVALLEGVRAEVQSECLEC